MPGLQNPAATPGEDHKSQHGGSRLGYPRCRGGRLRPPSDPKQREGGVTADDVSEYRSASWTRRQGSTGFKNLARAGVLKRRIENPLASYHLLSILNCEILSTSGLRSGKTMPDRSSPLVWWIYALFMPLGVPVIATLFYAAAHKQVVPFKPANLFDRWWMLYMGAFVLLQGPLAEEFGWRGYLLPRLLRKHTRLNASVLFGRCLGCLALRDLFPLGSADALFFASAVALST